MAFFLEALLGGLMAGMLYSLVALGFVLIFKASGVFNFAQGAMVLFAALAMARFSEWVPQILGLDNKILSNVIAFALAAALMFVLFYGLGNGLNTIVKGTAMAQYVSRDHVGQLNGVLGVPLALGRAAAPWALGLMWTPEVGYTHGLRWLLGLGVLGVACLWWAQISAHKLGANKR